MKFNNIIKIALALSIFASVGSCSEDRLDLYPDTDESLEGKIFNKEELQYLLNTAYGTVGAASGMGADAIIFGELMSDNAFLSIIHSGYYTGANAMNFSDASSEAGSAWARYYTVIRNANIIIYANVDSDILLDPEVKSIFSQAHIMKGLAYFMLAQYFSPSPKLGMDSPYGIVLKPDAWDSSHLGVRSTLQETYDEIVSELEKGLEHAPDQAEHKGIFTKTLANFLLAKTHLHFGNNEAAITYANKVLNESPAAFGLLDVEDYITYFTSNDETEQENQPETIYEVPQTASFNLDVNAHPATFFAYNAPHRSILYRPTFRDEFSDNDIRKELFGNNGPSSDDPTGIFIKKWQRKPASQGAYTQDIKVFRMTEALFIKWEAMAKLGQNPLDELNAFAQSRGGDTYSGDALTAVLEEKRKEFFGEGTRYYDLKRNGLPIVKETNCVINCNISADDKLFVFPIPSSQLLRNPAIIQYPGY